MNDWTGFLTLIEREAYRFGRLASQTVIPPVVMTVLFVLIFGYSLGEGIEQISGFAYIVYIVPGLAGMAIINNAYSNSSTSLFMARMDRSIENIIAAPISYFKVVGAFVVGGVVRGLIVGGLTLIVAAILTHLPIAHLGLTFLYLLAISVIFSALGIISALWAEDWDHLAVATNFIITPSIYLGGVFYSVKMLPEVWQKVSYVNPIFYLIDGFRFAILGTSDVSPLLSAGVIIGLALTTLAVSIYLFRIGYKLVV